jgi:hypothetical protein
LARPSTIFQAAGDEVVDGRAKPGHDEWRQTAAATQPDAMAAA